MLLTIDVTWHQVEGSLQLVAEGRDGADAAAVAVLEDLGLVTADLELTPDGTDFYMSRFVRQNDDETARVLREVLSRQAVATAFCGKLWGTGDVPVDGALSLLRRITKGSDSSGKRWLDVMNRARIVAYNRANPRLRVTYNPASLLPPAEATERERDRGHVISPDAPFGNLMVLADVLGAARKYIWWYEQHMPAKVLEVLYKQIDGENVSDVRLLSGPANVTAETKDQFNRFRREMHSKRRITAQWRVLSRTEAFRRHDRILISEGFARNLPPLNTILAGSAGEILPSQMTADDFDAWWQLGTDLGSFEPPATPAEAAAAAAE